MIGLVGCGQWGQLVLRDLKQLGARVCVVARSKSSVDRARAYGADAIVPTIADLPRALDGAVVVTPTDEHIASMEQLLAFGCPIFVEKAMGHDPVRLRRLVESAGERIFVMDKWRYHPGVERLRTLLAGGRLGRPVGLRSIRWGWSTRHHELDPVWLLLPHDISIALHVLGTIPKPAWARTSGFGPAGTSILAGLGGNGEPNVLLDVSSLHPLTRRSVLLNCEEGTAELGGSYDQEVVVRYGALSARDAVEEREKIADSMPLLLELGRFLAYLRGGPAPMSSAAEGLQIVETIVALRQLAGIGR